MWINEDTKGLFTLHADIRHECWKEGIELPGVLTDAVLSNYGYKPVVQNIPEYDPETQRLFARAPGLVDGVWTLGYNIVELSASQKEINRKVFARRRIYAEFEANSKAPVECTVPEGTFMMEGGYPSVQYIQGAHELSLALGEEQLYLTDVNNIPHQMSLESAKSVAIQIGIKWRDAFFVKQLALNELDAS